jgi:two-component system chemotaxis response regulator CheB
VEFETVGMVASLGGLDAVTAVLSALPAGFPAGVVVAQHGRRTDDPDRLARLLQRRCALPVRTVRTGDPVRGPGVAVVPTGCTATVTGDDRFAVAATAPHRPGEPASPGAGDELLRGLAGTLGPAAVAVVLTGMLRDGAQGVRAVKRAGGRVLVQDPQTARAEGMPSSAIATGCVDFVLPPERLGPALVTLVMAPGGADLLTVPTPPWAQLHT